MLSYSIAIRTLGSAGDKFIRELESIKRQSTQPDKVVVYIAYGGVRPGFQIGKEEYVWVKKGMVSQRLLGYHDVNSDVLFFLDDDMELAPDSAEKMLNLLEENKFDALGADTFYNHRMSVLRKTYSALVNLVTPHRSDKWAFRIKRNGSFSYNNCPEKDCYLSQSCGGPAWMIRKQVYDRLRLRDELWLDSFGYAYCEDQLETYKIYKNGYKLGVIFNSGIRNLDGASASANYKRNSERIYIRTKASFVIWWRTIYQTSFGMEKFLSILAFVLKSLWLFIVFCILSAVKFSFSYLRQYVRGLGDGVKFVHSPEFLVIPPYVATEA